MKSLCSLAASPSGFCLDLQEIYNPSLSRYQFFQLSGYTTSKNIFTYCKELGDIVHKVGPFMDLISYKSIKLLSDS